MRALLIKPDGTVREVVPKDKKNFTLEELYAHLECDIVEHVELAKGVHLWVDEEGKLKEENPVNQVATAYFHKSEMYKPELYRKAGLPVDVVVGNAIIEDRTKAGSYLD
jgi:hypothetical protein